MFFFFRIGHKASLFLSLMLAGVSCLVCSMLDQGMTLSYVRVGRGVIGVLWESIDLPTHGDPCFTYATVCKYMYIPGCSKVLLHFYFQKFM